MTHPATWTLASFLRAVDERHWLRHGLFWLMHTLVLTWMMRYAIHMMSDVRLAARDAVVMLPVHIGTIYPLLYGVLPKLWQPRGQPRVHVGWWLAGWMAFSLWFMFAYRFLVLVPLHANEFSTFKDYHQVFSTGTYFMVLAVAGVAGSLRVYRHWWQEKLGNLRLTQENYQAELQLLKAQIHPHFLFNTLNNLYSLTLKQSDQAPIVVERLTGLLRAVLHQSTAPTVPLADEVALLRHFIALERLRYGDRLTVDFEAGTTPATGHIAPLLLLPLVENAFKHGAAEQLGRAYIRLALAVEGTTFTCLIRNSQSPNDAPTTNRAGIGLRNVRQRLQLLYPQRHRFEVENQPDVFTVRLTLELLGPVEAPAPASPTPKEELPALYSPSLPLLAHENAG